MSGVTGIPGSVTAIAELSPVIPVFLGKGNGRDGTVGTDLIVPGNGSFWLYHTVAGRKQSRKVTDPSA